MTIQNVRNPKKHMELLPLTRICSYYWYFHVYLQIGDKLQFAD